MPAFENRGNFNILYTSSGSNSINLGVGTNNIVFGWLVTSLSTERIDTATIGGISCTLGTVTDRLTPLGVPGTIRKFKLVGSGLSGSQTLALTKTTLGGSPSADGVGTVFWEVYSGVGSISGETDISATTSLSPSATVSSSTGELVVWSALSNLAPNPPGGTITLTGSSGTTMRPGTTTGSNAAVIFEEAGATSTTVNGTATGTYTTTWLGPVYSLAGSTTAPIITLHPTNQSVFAGSSATFVASAVGSGSLTAQWQRNPGGNTSFANIGGAVSIPSGVGFNYTTAPTTITGGSANNGDTYRVIVTGDTAPPATSNTALLSVSPAPANVPFSPRPPYITG